MDLISTGLALPRSVTMYFCYLVGKQSLILVWLNMQSLTWTTSTLPSVSYCYFTYTLRFLLHWLLLHLLPVLALVLSRLFTSFTCTNTFTTFYFLYFNEYTFTTHASVPLCLFTFTLLQSIATTAFTFTSFCFNTRAAYTILQSANE